MRAFLPWLTATIPRPLLAAVCSFFLRAPAAPILAQTPGDTSRVTVQGTVLDAVSGRAPTTASVSLVNGTLRTATDSLGAFSLGAVPTGHRLLLVQAFGYQDLLMPVSVTTPMTPLEVRLEPNPIELPGLTVTGSASVTLTGVVLDASTGAGLSWASLGLRGERNRASADARGAFRLPRVRTGSYLLLVERLGYKSLYVQVRVTAPPRPLQIQLEPDPVVLEGLTVVYSRFRSRRNAYPRVVRDYGEDRLTRTAARDVVDFLRFESSVMFTSCPRPGGYLCVMDGRRVLSPRVYIDEVPVICGLDMLAAYQPQNLHLVEVYGRGGQIRIYTRAYVERLARRPEMLFDADLYPPALSFDC